MSGLHCARRLWLELHRPELLPPPSADDLRYLRQGQDVVARARQLWPDGRWPLPDERAIDLVADPTVTTLFEATFATADALARIDILTRLPGGGWHLIEVKSGSSVKDDYIVDAAIQAAILRAAGVDLQRVSLWTLSKRSQASNLATLFEETAVTAQTDKLLSEIQHQIAALREVATQVDEPRVALGRHCKDCPLQPHCWQHLGALAVFNIPNLTVKKAAPLVAAGIEHLADLPADFGLTPAQERYRRVMLSGEPYIDRAAIVREMNQLEYPLYFLDFEADRPALPRYPGAQPFQLFPFQFSCHICYADGRTQHAAYLHATLDDPRPPLLAALLAAIGRRGSIVVYSATFERTALRELAEAFPQHAPALRGMIDRLWDQHVIFKQQHYLAPGFGGSTSLKAVLPVLAPQLAYDDLAVQNGGAAVAAWNELLTLPAGAERDALYRQLYDYCARDTAAMVAVHDYLVQHVVRPRR